MIIYIPIKNIEPIGKPPPKTEHKSHLDSFYKFNQSIPTYRMIQRRYPSRYKKL